MAVCVVGVKGSSQIPADMLSKACQMKDIDCV